MLTWLGKASVLKGPRDRDYNDLLREDTRAMLYIREVVI